MNPISFRTEHMPNGDKTVTMEYLGRPDYNHKVTDEDLINLFNRVKQALRELHINPRQL